MIMFSEFKTEIMSPEGQYTCQRIEDRGVQLYPLYQGVFRKHIVVTGILSTHQKGIDWK
jgi:hypothetical protein